MELETALRHVAEIADAGFRAVWITGGEPMLRPSVVLKLIAETKAKGLKAVLGTNGYWGRDLDKCRDTMRELGNAGLDHIALSTDRWHEPFVPLAVIRNVISTARDNDIAIQISLTRALTDRFADEVESEFKEQGIPVNVQKLSRVGRARNLPEEMAPPNWERGDMCCLFAFVPQITPDGEVFACCGPRLGAGKDNPLWLGSLQTESLSEVLFRAHADPLLEGLQVLGSHRLLSRLFPEPEWAELRANSPDPCVKCLRVWSNKQIVEEARRRLKERDDVRLLLKALSVVLYRQYEKMRMSSLDLPPWLTLSSLKKVGELRYASEEGDVRNTCGVEECPRST